jgi:hypothetical protein
MTNFIERDINFIRNQINAGVTDRVSIAKAMTVAFNMQLRSSYLAIARLIKQNKIKVVNTHIEMVTSNVIYGYQIEKIILKEGYNENCY